MTKQKRVSVPVSDGIFAKLKKRAKENKRSVGGEASLLLEIAIAQK